MLHEKAAAPRRAAPAAAAAKESEIRRFGYHHRSCSTFESDAGEIVSSVGQLDILSRTEHTI